MRESFKDDHPISEFPSEDVVGIVPSEESSSAPQYQAPAGAGVAHDTACRADLTVPVVWYTPPRARRDVGPLSAAVTITVIQWLDGISAHTRRVAALLPPITHRLLALRRSLPAISVPHRYRPTISMPAVALVAGVTLGALGMWMMPDDGVGAVAESSSAEAARKPGDIALAGIGEARPSAATSGSQSFQPSRVEAEEVVPAKLTETTPSVRAEVTRPALDPAARRPSPKPPLTRPQPAARRPAATAASQYRGSLSVRSRPEGASVFVNGRLVGTTPLVLKDEAVGSRAVRVALSGYDPWSAAAQVVAYRQTAVSADLRSSASGKP